MSFKPGDRVIADNVVWLKEPGAVVLADAEFLPLREGYIPVRFDSFEYNRGNDYHAVHISGLSPERGGGLDPDPINPTHYQFPGGVQVIDLTRHLGFLEGNIVKYVARAGRKGAAKEDLLKARQYLDWLIGGY